MNKKRRDFLMNTCPTVALAFMGVTMLEACSSAGDDSYNGENNSDGNGGSESNSGTGYSTSGSNVIIDLSHSAFSKLQNDGWMNFTAMNILLLKVDSSTYRAFTNECPHASGRSKWSYNTSASKFVCGYHGHSYPDDCQTSGTAGGKLNCYTTSFKDNKLTVTVS